LPVPILVVALELALARSYRSAFAGLMRARVAPDGAKQERTATAVEMSRDSEVRV
jgi:hypothetical protein